MESDSFTESTEKNKRAVSGFRERIERIADYYESVLNVNLGTDSVSQIRSIRSLNPLTALAA